MMVMAVMDEKGKRAESLFVFCKRYETLRPGFPPKKERRCTKVTI
jgi:hypothetical protein